MTASRGAPEAVEGEPFAFTSGRYGNRPVFLLTRRWAGDAPSLSLYELAPTALAEAHRERFADSHTAASLTLHELSSVVVDGDSPADIQQDGSVHDWSDWRAVKIAALKRTRNRTAVNCLVRPTLDGDGFDSTRVCGGGAGSLALPEAVGVRFSIAFRALKPMQRTDRLRAVADGVAEMSLGECYYWHAKMRSPTTPNGAPALRTLLSNHID